MHLQADRKLRIILIAYALWLLIVCLLGGWWGRLGWRQARQIAELESRVYELQLSLAQQQQQYGQDVGQVVTAERGLGLAGAQQNAAQFAGEVHDHWYHTRRMLFWESTVFFGLLLACTGGLIWVYGRDLKRGQGLTAFFASVTHELRTPLTSIRLQAEAIADHLQYLVQDRVQSLTVQRPDVLQAQEVRFHALMERLVPRLLEDTLRLESQVERTLELARVEGGGLISSQPLPLQTWLEQFLKKWQVHYAGQIEIETRDVLGSSSLSLGAEGLEQEDDWGDVGGSHSGREVRPARVVEADPMALQIIFKNILENAMKHGGEQLPAKVLIAIEDKLEAGRLGVQITLHHPQPAPSHRSDGCEQGFVAFSETSHPQPKAARALVLQPWGMLFHKGPHSSGAGVGLYLVKVLMAQMKGWARFQRLEASVGGDLDRTQQGFDDDLVCGSENVAGFRVTLWFPGGREWAPVL